MLTIVCQKQLLTFDLGDDQQASPPPTPEKPPTPINPTPPKPTPSPPVAPPKGKNGLLGVSMNMLTIVGFTVLLMMFNLH